MSPCADAADRQGEVGRGPNRNPSRRDGRRRPAGAACGACSPGDRPVPGDDDVVLGQRRPGQEYRHCKKGCLHLRWFQNFPGFHCGSPFEPVDREDSGVEFVPLRLSNPVSPNFVPADWWAFESGKSIVFDPCGPTALPAAPPLGSAVHRLSRNRSSIALRHGPCPNEKWDVWHATS